MTTAISNEEFRQRFLEFLCKSIDAASKMEKKIPARELLEQFTFHVLAAIDLGQTDKRYPELPPLLLAPMLSREDRDLRAERGQDAFPDNSEVAGAVQANISGNLHREFLERRKPRPGPA